MLRARETLAQKKSECRKNIGTNTQINRLTRNEKPNTKSSVIPSADKQTMTRTTKKLVPVCLALVPLGGVAGCGQSACNAHPNGLACEQEQGKHAAEEVANRRHEEENTPQAKEERREREAREREPSEKYNGREVAQWFTEEELPRASEKVSCPEGTYEEYPT